MSTANSELVFEGGGRRGQLRINRHPRAKSMRLKVDNRTGLVTLTIPKRASERRARRWAETHRDWVEGELAKLPLGRPITPGSTIDFRGERLIVDWQEDRRRTPQLGGDTLSLGGPADRINDRIIRWLRERARETLTEETRRYAGRAGVTVARISIGDARTRWGSCSASGAIRYNWRLVMAPPRILQATVAHEVAHRVHMNHGPDFHALVAEIYGASPDRERQWLRDNGAALYWVGCSS